MNALKYLFLMGALMATGCEAATPVEPVIDSEAADALRFLYQEEKVARDVYDSFEALYGLMPFVHISDSEQSHFEQMETLLLSLGVITEEEIIRTEPGVFTDPDLQALYDELSERGADSEIEALRVGAYIEEHDILDLGAAAALTDHPDVQETLNALIAASGNHLRAFNRNLANRGVDYEPVLLNADYFDQIIAGRAAAGCCSEGGKHAKGQGQQGNCNHE